MIGHFAFATLHSHCQPRLPLLRATLSPPIFLFFGFIFAIFKTGFRHYFTLSAF